MVEAISTSETTITTEYTTYTLTAPEKNETESNCTSTLESVTTLPCSPITSAVPDTTMTSHSNTEATTYTESMSTGKLTTNVTDSFTTKAELPTNTISTDKPTPNRTFSSEQTTQSTVTSLTTTTKNTIAGNSLSVSYPLSK
ncbi:hypothetical protein DPMN_189221 [Dreissena polymorpha]|uniref:Uncharacterized protein n=1 Tax=Dreissena polymorpha TaxID=45954 RepID=A0A9D4DTY8_DREPO|nr:hypothetical protein DPMN_189221 [Dreissena polymorpha]